MSQVESNKLSHEGPNPSTEPAPAQIELTIGDQKQKLSYRAAFALACGLLQNDRVDDASKVFGKLEEFTDRGPRAFIMHAFCESAAKRYDASKERLDAAFSGENAQIAAEINDAFVIYHISSRKEGMSMIAELVHKHENLPTLCVLLGNVLQSRGDLSLAKRCWSMAVHRDRPHGAVGGVAMHYLRHADE